MVRLNAQERDKLVAYLDESAESDAKVAEQLEKLGDSHKAMVKKYRTEALAQKIVADKMRNMETFTVG